jgi:hypothetical protein
MKSKKILAGIAGMLLIVAGLAGLLFSVLGLVGLTHLEPRVEATLSEQFKQVDQSLVAMSDGLATADTLLSTAINSAGSLQETTAYASKTLQDGVYGVDSTADLVGEQLPAVIESTREALTSLAASAELVDDILAALTSVPLSGTDRYTPEVPLSQGILEVAQSLEDLPHSLDKVDLDMSTTQDKLQAVGENLAATTDQIGQITISLKGAQSAIAQYQEIVTNLQGLSSSALQSMPGWLDALRWGFSLTLIWFGIAQIVLLTQGWGLIGRSRATITPDRPATPEP